MLKLGATVADTHGVGGGFPDMVVGYCGQNFLVEIKDGSRYASERKLRDGQLLFMNTWRGQYVVIDSIDAAIGFLNKILVERLNK